MNAPTKQGLIRVAVTALAIGIAVGGFIGVALEKYGHQKRTNADVELKPIVEVEFRATPRNTSSQGEPWYVIEMSDSFLGWSRISGLLTRQEAEHALVEFRKGPPR